MAKGRNSYSDEERAAALAALKANGGNVKRTAAQVGVPRKTLAEWARTPAPVAKSGEGVATSSPPEKTGTYTAAQRAARQVEGYIAPLADLYESIAYKALDLAPDKLPLLSAKELVVTAAVATDKMRLLRGESTHNLLVRPDLANLTDEELDALDRLAAAARGHRVREVPAIA